MIEIIDSNQNLHENRYIKQNVTKLNTLFPFSANFNKLFTFTLCLPKNLNQGLAPDPFGLGPFFLYQCTNPDLYWLHLLLIYMGLKEKNENSFFYLFSKKFLINILKFWNRKFNFVSPHNLDTLINLI
ncbi:hypothetical protein BpHYR1_026773 [Brachionus plicatilis]|uniref:Uncharacterized protein n=1 Tax=Brachionus plicatilis TaxID=10195 RepID=A0A3M7QG06_BRAPC|nr:hypothetical protein BpHYR1_026773 [Brachionus plicatilis]